MPTTPSALEERYKLLNKEQKEAVDQISGPVMVIAGPGTGKTELLGLRVANILRRDEDVTPGNILCLTFTDAAAFNMRDRLIGLLGHSAYRVAVHTFHSFGTELINHHPEYFYRGAAFLPADDVTQIEILEEIFESLDHGDPLRSQYKEQFTYLYKVKQAIEYIKKAGLTPDEFEKIIAANKSAIEKIDPLIHPVFGQRVSKKLVEPAREILEAIEKRDKGKRDEKLPGGFDSFPRAFAGALTEALDAMAEGGTSPLTEWKKRWTSKGDDGQVHLADMVNQEKIDTIAHVYREYMKEMHERGYFDFNDMILDAIVALEKNPGLRGELVDHYKYILVDEFQDTNNAQMRLLQLLTDDPRAKGRPNILVVGDDDQAIFKFQGAELSNILDFKKMYIDPKLVVLSSNYRSTQEILDLARHVIKKGVTRLETAMPGLIKKELNAAGAKGALPGMIAGKEFPSRDLEYQWIAKEAGRLIKEGIAPKQIAVIAREHKDLEAIVPHFHAAKIPVAYDREENVLRVPHILQLVTMAQFVNSLMQHKLDPEDDLLPEILSYPFWNIDRVKIWELSLRTHAGRKPWITVMQEMGGKLGEIAKFFIDLGADAKYKTAEEILHELIGGPQLMVPEDDGEEDEEEDGGARTPRHEMFSPFRTFYFGKNKFDNARPEYLRFLSALRSLVRALREYHPGAIVRTADMVAFVDTHIKNRLVINNISPFANAGDAVPLMSAHKAKGLEFEAVFVVNCEEGVWADSGHGRSVPLPSNMPIGPAGDTLDDQLRLFYVAITRAKRLLYLAVSRANDRGKEVSGLSFLASGDGAPALYKSELVDVRDIAETAEDILVGQWMTNHSAPYVPDEKALLAPILLNYKLSVTHLHNFLNVADAGPVAFLEKNLLRFPEPKSPNASFGSAVHATISRIYTHLRSGAVLPSTEEVVAWFKRALINERMNEDNFKRMLKRGEKTMSLFYEKKKDIFVAADLTERDFQEQGVVVGGAPLTGKVDRMSLTKRGVIVSDFKTGKAITKWDPADPYEKIKALHYREQIIFYKLLIENSREFNGTTVGHGIIQFVEPSRGKIGELEMEIEPAEVERLKAIIEAVYKKIVALDFPDVSAYSKDVYGIRKFEDDLLGEI